MIESPRNRVKARACRMKFSANSEGGNRGIVIRVNKRDSAYLYQILESYEGLANYSTITVGKEQPFRDIALHAAPDLLPEIEALLKRLSNEIPLEPL